MAWDSAGDIFVADGAVPSRVAKFDKNGMFIKSWGGKGDAPGQFNVPHSIVVDSKDNVYIADRGNKRIQVFDTDGNLKTQYTNIGSPWALCITSGPHPYLYSSDSNSNDFDNATIYKMELDGTILGKFGAGGKQLKEFGTVHEIDCRKDNEVYVAEITNWRVQKLILHPTNRNQQRLRRKIKKPIARRACAIAQLRVPQRLSLGALRPFVVERREPTRRRVKSNHLSNNPERRHSEERSDEESLLSLTMYACAAPC